jgi:hypothetical protein
MVPSRTERRPASGAFALRGLAAVALFFVVRVDAYGNLCLRPRRLGLFFMEQVPASLAHNFLFFGTTVPLGALFGDRRAVALALPSARCTGGRPSSST